MNRYKPWILLSVVIASLAFAFVLPSNRAQAALDPPLYSLSSIVPIPNFNAQACYDIATVQRDTLYLADSTNRAVDAINGTHVSFIGQNLFTGTAGCHQFDFSQQGPTGTLIEHGMLWAGDGNSTVKVFELSTGKRLATIATGPASNKRADELDYIPVTNQVVIANPDAPHPYLTYINASTLKVVHYQSFENATAGLEQPRYAHGLLYQAVPATTTNPGGEIDAINPFTYKITARFPTPNCGPNGLVILRNLAATGCGNGANEIVNLTSGRVIIATGTGATDMVAADYKRGHFFFASYASSTLYVTDTTGHILQKIPTDSRAHSVAVNPRTGELFIPVGSLGGIAEYLLN